MATLLDSVIFGQCRGVSACPPAEATKKAFSDQKNRFAGSSLAQPTGQDIRGPLLGGGDRAGVWCLEVVAVVCPLPRSAGLDRAGFPWIRGSALVQRMRGERLHKEGSPPFRGIRADSSETSPGMDGRWCECDLLSSAIRSCFDRLGGCANLTYSIFTGKIRL